MQRSALHDRSLSGKNDTIEMVAHVDLSALLSLDVVVVGIERKRGNRHFGNVVILKLGGRCLQYVFVLKRVDFAQCALKERPKRGECVSVPEWSCPHELSPVAPFDG